MEESAAGKQPGRQERSRHLQVFGVRVDRVGRWLVCSVVLATAPILLSFIFLPQGTSVTSFLAHGDFAVLALALVAASLGELFGPDHPVRWVQTVLALSCVTMAIALMTLLAGIAGHAARLTTEYDARFSVYSLIFAVVVGAISWWSTSPQPYIRSETDDKKDVTEAPMQ
jgi:hypothetical protein